MAPSPEEKEPAFKVVDKRRFTEEGEANDHNDCCEHDHGHNDSDTILNDQKASEESQPEMDFTLFVQSLAHQAMMGLGLVPWPDSGLIKKEPSLAQQTIDILLILKDKTGGNLSAEEQALLDGMLYQLQLAFVELSQSPPSAPGTIIK